MRVSRLCIPVALLAVVAGTAGATVDTARAIRLTTDAPTDSVTVGERLHVRYTAVFPDSLVLLPPGQLDTGKSRLVSLEWSELDREGTREKHADLTVLPLDLETARVPALPFHFLTPASDTITVWSDAVEVPVKELTQAESRPKPLKPQWEAPRSYMKPILIAAGVLLAAIAALLLWRHRRRRVVEPEPEPVLPADFVALTALQEIERMNLVEVREYKRHYTLVVDVLRRYLEQRYGILAMDRTSDEVFEELRLRRRDVDGLEPLLREADLVKFAKFVPGDTQARDAIERARDIVVQTTPRPLPPAPEAETVGAVAGEAGGAVGRSATGSDAGTGDSDGRAH